MLCLQMIFKLVFISSSVRYYLPRWNAAALCLPAWSISSFDDGELPCFDCKSFVRFSKPWGQRSWSCHSSKQRCEQITEARRPTYRFNGNAIVWIRLWDGKKEA